MRRGHAEVGEELRHAFQVVELSPAALEEHPAHGHARSDRRQPGESSRRWRSIRCRDASDGEGHASGVRRGLASAVTGREPDRSNLTPCAGAARADSRRRARARPRRRSCARWLRRPRARLRRHSAKLWPARNEPSSAASRSDRSAACGASRPSDGRDRTWAKPSVARASRTSRPPPRPAARRGSRARRAARARTRSARVPLLGRERGERLGRERRVFVDLVLHLELRLLERDELGEHARVDAVVAREREAAHELRELARRGRGSRDRAADARAGTRRRARRSRGHRRRAPAPGSSPPARAAGSPRTHRRRRAGRARPRPADRRRRARRAVVGVRRVDRALPELLLAASLHARRRGRARAAREARRDAERAATPRPRARARAARARARPPRAAPRTPAGCRRARSITRASGKRRTAANRRAPRPRPGTVRAVRVDAHVRKHGVPGQVQVADALARQRRQVARRVDAEVLRVHVQVVDVEQHAAAAAPAELGEEAPPRRARRAKRDVARSRSRAGGAGRARPARARRARRRARARARRERDRQEVVRLHGRRASVQHR